ncbi:hypothetical protein DM785_19210 (plasmid) [Deinococcus actinosclerus]|nr:hypothetical protein DM785_19210 [Deinococcus actinosclerus]
MDPAVVRAAPDFARRPGRAWGAHRRSLRVRRKPDPPVRVNHVIPRSSAHRSVTCVTDTEGLRAALLARAPSWALCGDTPQDAGDYRSRRRAAEALQHRFCQLNPRGRLGVIIVDIDHQHGLNLLDAPPPTYTTFNPTSGHQQAGYILAEPVARGGRSRAAPARLADDVRRNLTQQLAGDAAFSGFISRGPFHAAHDTRIVGGRLWTLGELLRALPPMRALPRRIVAEAADLADAEGRNVAMFEALRRVAYRRHDAGTGGAALLAQVTAHARDLNRRVLTQHAAGPLPERELAGIVRSICRWTDAHHRPAGPNAGSSRSRIHSSSRTPLSAEEATQRRREGQQETSEIRSAKTATRLQEAERELLAAGRLVTAAALMELTGVGRSTALRYLRNAANSPESG